MQKQRIPWLSLFIIFIVIYVVVSGVRAFIKQKDMQDTAYTTSSEDPYYNIFDTSKPDNQVTATPTPVQQNFLTDVLLKKDQKFADPFIYPTELYDIAAASKIKCTTIFPRQLNGTFYIYTPERNIELVDPTLLAFIDEINASTETDVATVQKCITQNSKSLVIYNYEPVAGLGTAFAAQLQDNGRTTQVLQIPNNGAAYFSCEYPLLYTQENVLYIKCGGGDGASSLQTLYKADFANSVVTPVLSCTGAGECK